MRKLIALMGIVILAVGILAVNTASAGNVTIFDTLGNLNSPGTNTGGEDQETEPGTLTPQKWDLEGFFTSGTNISMVGGYDFAAGYGVVNGSGTAPGTLFIANNNATPLFGTTAGAFTGLNKYGYNYAVTMDFTNLTYSLYAIDATTAVISTGFVLGSNPWELGQGGTQTLVDPNSLGYTGTLQYITGLTNAQTGFLSDASQTTHNEVVLVGIGNYLPDYAASDPNYFAYLHYTYECGNDLLIGQIVGSPVPIPPSALLLGTGLLGLVGLGYRRRKTNV